MEKKEIDFKVVCSCGKTNNGFFSDEDQVEKLHCKCGLTWEIRRPVEKSN